MFGVFAAINPDKTCTKHSTPDLCQARACFRVLPGSLISCSKSQVATRKSKRDVSKAKVSIKKRQIIQPGKPAITILGSAGLKAVINIPSSVVVRAGKRKKTSTDAYVVLNAAVWIRDPSQSAATSDITIPLTAIVTEGEHK